MRRRSGFVGVLLRYELSEVGICLGQESVLIKTTEKCDMLLLNQEFRFFFGIFLDVPCHLQLSIF